MATDDAEITAQLADRVAAAKERAGITRTALAESTGIPYSTLGRKLDGFSDFTMPDIYRIAKALGVAPASLLPAAFTAKAAA